MLINVGMLATNVCQVTEDSRVPSTQQPSSWHPYDWPCIQCFDTINIRYSLIRLGGLSVRLKICESTFFQPMPKDRENLCSQGD